MGEVQAALSWAAVVLSLVACQSHSTPPSSTPQFRLEMIATLAGSPDEVFPYLHDPTKLGWLGNFRLVEPGDDPEVPSGLGSVRRVSFITPIVEETIVDFAPPSTLQYEVSYSKSYVDHHASMRLTPLDADHTELRWVVEFDSMRRNPEAHFRFTKRFLHRALGRLDRRIVTER
jgi:hypothetical protein